MAAALGRLDGVIAEETEALTHRRAVDLDEINRRKSQSLLEITRLARTLPAGRQPQLGARLAAVRDRLAANHRLLGLHMEAARELADLMAGLLSDAESDGTYRRPLARGGAR